MLKCLLVGVHPEPEDIATAITGFGQRAFWNPESDARPVPRHPECPGTGLGLIDDPLRQLSVKLATVGGLTGCRTERPCQAYAAPPGWRLAALAVCAAGRSATAAFSAASASGDFQ